MVWERQGGGGERSMVGMRWVRVVKIISNLGLEEMGRGSGGEERGV